MMKRFVTILIFLAAIASSLSPIVSYAATTSNGLLFQDVATGFCLDSNTSGQAYTLACNGGAFQRWRTSFNSIDSSNTLQDVATGFCLDSNTSGQVYTLACNGGAFQHWRAFFNSIDGSYTLQDVATGFCLDSNTSGHIYTLACNGGAFQHWRALQ